MSYFPAHKRHSVWGIGDSDTITARTTACSSLGLRLLSDHSHCTLTSCLMSFLIPSFSLFPHSLRPSRHSSRQLSLSDSVWPSIHLSNSQRPDPRPRHASENLLRLVPLSFLRWYRLSIVPFLVSIWLLYLISFPLIHGILYSTIPHIHVSRLARSCLPPYVPSLLPWRPLQSITRSPSM
jgi:hypothetical protein